MSWDLLVLNTCRVTVPRVINPRITCLGKIYKFSRRASLDLNFFFLPQNVIPTTAVAHTRIQTCLPDLEGADGEEAVAAVTTGAGEVSAEAEAAAAEDEGRYAAVAVAVAVAVPEVASGVTITGLGSLCCLQFPLDLCHSSDNYI